MLEHDVSTSAIRVYSPEPALRNPGRFFSDMLGDLRVSWELSVAIARRDLSAMYRQSILGYVWAFLPVVATTAVFLFLRSGGGFATNQADVPYPAFVLIGSCLWQIFSDAVQGPLKVISSSRPMLVKVNFPRESLIVAAMLITFFNFLIRLIILVPALAYFSYKGQIEIDSRIFLFPAGVVGLVLLGYTIGVLLTPIGMLYKDVTMGVTMVLSFWMFLSPVVVPLPADGILHDAMLLNPVTPMIDTCRAWLVGTNPEYLGHFGIVFLVSVCLLFVGWILYRVSLPHVIARLGM